jgi:hypothetical protein
MALHQVDRIAPQPTFRLNEAAQCVTFVGKKIARCPNLVRNEQPVRNAQRRSEIAHADFAGAIQGRRIEDAGTAIQVRAHDLLRRFARLTGNQVECHERAKTYRWDALSA